ncbi:GNAT family N-acetyltransferase [Streptomyces sp. HU2014]|uniref:GNAT family N-acetyltransferase n=1 Tax=Streptomyces sp. HU2014 TaxID=2939414 RepID=UPI00200D5B52|nr:GNAT family N-acetyltransferase [Streptomyces sp. HU2014]UQI45300.1 GNAT family N-acetyltransferase [Streptomyces sp. HU2014]
MTAPGLPGPRRPPAPAPARSAAPYRAVLRARYAWDTGPRLAAVRVRWDGARRPFTACSPPDGPVRLCYTGLGDGSRHILAFLRQRGVDTVATRPGARHSAPVDIRLSGLPARRVPVPGPATVVLPFRVRLVVPVGAGPGALRARISARESRTFRAGRAARGWTWETGTGPHAFDHFYERMHLPTMRRRHGEATRSLSAALAYECLFRKGILFFLVEDGTRVAGVLCARGRHHRVLTMRLLGVLDGAEQYYADGAVRALTHFTLEWADAHGFDHVDLSGCEPFLSKGIFQFKQRFHPECRLPDDHFGGKRLVLRVGRDTPRVRDLLVANPVIACGDDGFEALYFHDADRPPRTDLAWRCPGVRRARHVPLDAFLRDVREPGPA